MIGRNSNGKTKTTMKKFLTILLLLTFGICSGQNLVPNGDFEEYWGCPTGMSEIDSAKFWMRPSMGTSDYLNECATTSLGANVPNTFIGFQQAHSGSGFAGEYIYIPSTSSSYREYIEVALDSVLSNGSSYHFEMYMNLGNSCNLTTYNIGVYFSNTIITGIPASGNLPFTPQINNITGNSPDTLNWTLVSGNYIASGGESFLIIGNFLNNFSTNTTVGNPSGSYNTVYVFIDDVSLTRCGDGCNTGDGIINNKNEVELSVFPNPMTDKLTIKINNNEPAEIIIYDISSRKLLQQTFTNSITINTGQLAKGMFLYEVRNRNGIIKNGKVIKQ
jgi:OOP family OmpA-OmpF porin